METSTKLVVALVIVLVGIGMLFSLAPFGTIETGNRGIVKRYSKAVQVLGEGFYWKKPFVEHIEEMNVQTIKYETKAAAASKDKQNVDSHLAVNLHPDPQDKHLLHIYRQLGQGYLESVVSPAVQEAYKSATSHFTADQLITDREATRKLTEKYLAEDLKRDFIIIDRVNIVNFKFSKEYTKSIEETVRAQQDALTEKNKLQAKQFSAQQKVIMAKAEAEALLLSSTAEAKAISIKGIALRANPEYTSYKAVLQWDGKMPTYWGGAGPLPMLNIK